MSTIGLYASSFATFCFGETVFTLTSSGSLASLGVVIGFRCLAEDSVSAMVREYKSQKHRTIYKKRRRRAQEKDKLVQVRTGGVTRSQDRVIWPISDVRLRRPALCSEARIGRNWG